MRLWKKRVNRFRWECGQHQTYGEWFTNENDARAAYWREHSPNVCDMATAKIFHDRGAHP